MKLRLTQKKVRNSEDKLDVEHHLIDDQGVVTGYLGKLTMYADEFPRYLGLRLELPAGPEDWTSEIVLGEDYLPGGRQPMSLRHEYIASKQYAGDHFYELLMGAMRQADSTNAWLLKAVFPDVWDQLQQRYNAPYALLPGERDVENGVRRDGDQIIHEGTGEVLRDLSED